jgi:hypothetical protein
MKTIQFNANQILNGNNYPIAENMVIISTGHDDSIINNPEGYQEYIIPILEAIQNCSLRNYYLRLASITSTVTDYQGTHTWVFTTDTFYNQEDIEYLIGALTNVFDDDYFEPIINYTHGTFIVTQPYSC